ncbi:MAG: hypothetical protein H6730_19875 [Deltaproteobacteria bacterium]|nr:hypothetical protein [Deltaproteobacteria bacterium]
MSGAQAALLLLALAQAGEGPDWIRAEAHVALKATPTDGGTAVDGDGPGPKQAPARSRAEPGEDGWDGSAGPGPKVGEAFNLVVEAVHAPGSVAILPAQLKLPDALAERVAARQHQRTPGATEDKDVYTLELLAFEAGTFEIPGIPVALGARTATTAPLTIEVTTTLSEDEQLVASSTRPEALAELEKMTAQGPPPREVLVPDYTAVWVLLGAVLLVAAVILLLRLSGRRRALAPVGPPPPPPRPAHEVALEALDALQKADPLARGDYKGHYTALSTILRAYLGGRYGFESLELTHDELMDALTARKTAGLDRTKVDMILAAADQVKFAKYVPVKEDGYEAMQGTRQIVQATLPKPPPPEGAS